MQDSVTIHMDASPQEIWDLVSDVTRIGSYSPETFEAEWTDGATGPAVGARFRGHVKRNGRGPTYWAPCVVTECVPGEVFTFGVGKPGKALNTWSYRLAPGPDGAGTDVTESFQLTPNLGNKIYWALAGWTRGKTNRKGMQTTLERIKAEVEKPS
ncbi:MAG TPA: SRPBCC family protein [Acidimicrobiales bacterium]